MGCCGLAGGAVVAPYTPDANTLHLWNFDQSGSGPVTPVAGVTGSFDLTLDGSSPETSSTLGATAYPGYGTAGDTTAGTGAGFRGAAVPITSVTGANGAFTFEAMIRTGNISSLQMVISMEGNNNATERPFQFRISGGDLNFINISGGGNDPSATIPVTGPDAFVANQWFHVAAAYDGNETSLTDNFKLYWTQVDASRTSANEIGSAIMDADLAGNTLGFGVGNDYRTAGSGNTSSLDGQIDQVRVSDLARTADDMLFAVPEPSSSAFLALAGLALLGRRRP